MILIDIISVSYGMSRIRKGKNARLSPAQLALTSVNMPDAIRNLSPEQSREVQKLSQEYRKMKKKRLFTPETIVEEVSKLILEFNAIAPYDYYGGGSIKENRAKVETALRYLLKI